MMTIGTLMGWLMASLSAGPLLLTLVMLSMLRGHRVDDG
jgi:ribose/xylose/arabinose/galactoside ABC-type transport system permease subunit